MTNPSPWNLQAPVARSAFPHPARRGKRKEGSGSRRTPVPAGAVIAAPTPCPGGHETGSGSSTARSTGTPVPSLSDLRATRPRKGETVTAPVTLDPALFVFYSL